MKTVRSILKEQSSLKVVLNGGSFELQDATIPFQIGFSKQIADFHPTHILVMDVANDPFDREGNRSDYDSSAERTLFKLQPVHYLRLKRPGIHHLIFIVLSGEIGKDKRQYFLEKTYANYEHELWFSEIERNNLGEQICYTEVVVDVPELFFAKKPETKTAKVVWKWANSWYKLKPINQCEYRKRKIVAFTIKPVLWFLGFIVRIMFSLVLTVISFVIRLLFLFFGSQPVSFLPNRKKLWVNFLFLYPREGYKSIVFNGDNWLGNDGDDDDIRYKDMKDIDFFPYKTLAIGKKRIYTPIALSGLTIYSVFLFGYGYAIYEYFNKSFPYHGVLFVIQGLSSIIFAILVADSTLPSIRKSYKWKRKWTHNDEKKVSAGFLIFFICFSIAFLVFLVTQVPWLSVWHFMVRLLIATFTYILGFLAVMALSYGLIKLFKTKALKKAISFIGRLKFFTEKEIVPEKKVIKVQPHDQWLHKSFDITTLPKSIDFKKMPEPSTVVHKFTIGFWRLKAKVCKPYAK